MTHHDDPLLSVVIAIVSDTTEVPCNTSHLIGCLEAIRQQRNPPPLEVIVPYHANVGDIPGLQRQYPEVTFVPVDDPQAFACQGGVHERHDRLRTCGLALAQGEIVGLLEDHARPHMDWSRNMVQAHRQDYVAIGGVIENEIDAPLNWAVYQCDFARYQSPLPAGESDYVSDANVTFKRAALEAIYPVWQDGFHETEVTWALARSGGKLALFPDIVVYQHRSSLRLGDVLKERVIWGRAYGASRGRVVGAGKRAAYALVSPTIPFVLLVRNTADGLKRRRPVAALARTLPPMALLTVFWSMGEFMGYVTGRES